MYKTVRQGENSLQYTILPQTEEVLTNSGVKGKGRDYSPSSHARRINRKLMIYYMAIIFFGLLLAFGTLLFALILCGIVPIDHPNHTNTAKEEQMAMKAAAPLTTTQPDRNPTRKKELVHDSKTTLETSTHSINSAVPNTTVKDSEVNSTLTTENVSTVATTNANLNQTSTTERAWIMPALKRRLASSTTTSTMHPGLVDTQNVLNQKHNISYQNQNINLSSSYPHQRESNTDLMLDRDQLKWPQYDDEDYDSTKTSTVPTTQQIVLSTTVKDVHNDTNTTVSSPPISKTSTVSSVKLIENKFISELDPKGKNKSKMDAVKYMEMKEHILDDDDDDYKEPLTDEDDVSEQPGSDDVKMSQAKSSWLQTRWPFVDPSSYFQWTVSLFNFYIKKDL